MLLDKNLKDRDILCGYKAQLRLLGLKGLDGWREERDEYCLVWSPGCCGELDETLL